MTSRSKNRVPTLRFSISAIRWAKDFLTRLHSTSPDLATFTEHRPFLFQPSSILTYRWSNVPLFAHWSLLVCLFAIFVVLEFSYIPQHQLSDAKNRVLLTSGSCDVDLLLVALPSPYENFIQLERSVIHKPDHIGPDTFLCQNNIWSWYFLLRTLHRKPHIELIYISNIRSNRAGTKIHSGPDFGMSKSCTKTPESGSPDHGTAQCAIKYISLLC